MKKGLTRSALSEVQRIYARAKQEKNAAQLTKSVLYMASLQQSLQDSRITDISLLEKEIPTAPDPAKPVLQSVLAEAYLRYFQNNRWNIYDRTATINFNKNDVETWSQDDFHKKISALYLQSIADETMLQQTSIERLDPVVSKGNVRYLRPTLFDLLAHRALDYFKDEERLITRPAYAFEIDDARAFSDAAVFAKHRFGTKDSLSLHYKALQLYQRLISFHLKDPNPAALLDADIERIAFVKTHCVMADKDSLYKAALERLVARYPSTKEAAQAWYLLAEIYAEKARKYHPVKDTANRYEFLAAKRICEQVLAMKGNAEGISNAEKLLNEITKKELAFKAEQVNLPGAPFRMLVEYRNVSQLYLRVIKIDHDTWSALGKNYDRDEQLKKLAALPVLKTITQNLPATNDYQTHYVEIKVDALPTGHYALLGSVSKDYDPARTEMEAQFIYVSGISFINNKQDHFVLDRETGKPLAGAKVQAWQIGYNYNTRSWEKAKGSQFITNSNGWFYFNPQKEKGGRQGVSFEISTSNDYLFIDEANDVYYPADYRDRTTGRTTFLFTDRSIYRPGQTLYFKGIMVQKDSASRNSSIITGRRTSVYLYNANYQKIDSVSLTTSDYGSYSATFTLPSTGLTGNFIVEDSFTRSRAYVSVEEYKRPKFEVAYEDLKDTYRLNDSVTITGFAKAYAGNNIDGATVRYRITRTPRFVYPWLFWKRSYPPVTPQEIAHGEMVTGADGKFTITFKAIPDKSISKELDPDFDYTVAADVTDINGETRSASTSIRVSYRALQLTVAPPGLSLPADSLKRLIVKTTNLAGVHQSAKVKVTLTKLNAPNRLIRPRYWEQPDQFVMTQEEYLKLFPHDEYSDESNKEAWPKLERVYERTDTTAAYGIFNLPDARLAPGWYMIEAAATDKYGTPVKSIQYVELTQADGTPATPAYTWFFPDNAPKEPGQTAIAEAGSSARDLFVIQEIDTARNGSSTYQFITLDNQKKTFAIPLTEAHRGGFGVRHVFVRHNRVFTTENNVMVPWSNKALKISYETYRDKTLPGSEETWKVKLSGYNNTKVAAEILTAMYDQSLDQFKPHGWQPPPIWNLNASMPAWSSNNFRLSESLGMYRTDSLTRSFEKAYDYLLTDIYGLSQGSGYFTSKMLQGRMAMAKATPEAAQAYNMNGEGDAARELVDEKASQDTEAIVAPQQQQQPVQVRRNFNETAFFFPGLKTDSAGNVSFSFTMPEALTKWKWMMLAHTKDLAMAGGEQSIVSQKELMVQPNIPRFLREGDRMDLSAKIVNMGAKELSGQIELQLVDAATNQSVDGWFQNMFPNQYFTAAAGQSAAINFTIQVPFQYNKPVAIRFIARAGNLGDGEENAVPVLSNKQLVIETLPLNIRGTGNKQFTFGKLLKSGESETLSHQSLTVEFTSNPAWYAVQALPYLMEYPYECAEQLWNRVYANALAAKIVNASPRIKTIFERWKTTDTAALLSNLQKNSELKTVLLEETPWVLQANNETEQKQRIAMLFDMVKLSEELSSNLEKLAQLQSANGGFVWFKGGPDDRYITQYILTGIGHLKKLDAIPASLQPKINAIVQKALPYLDARMKDDYDRLVKSKADLSKQQIGYLQINYLYMRSFFTDINAAGNVSKPFSYYRKQAQQFWVKQSRYMQGMIALSLFRTGDGKTAADILRSLRQNAILNDEMGMYWKDVTGGYYWYQAPIETQSLMIEAFTEIAKDNKTADALKTWLLKNKQTNNWRTTRATADACYALLLQGTDWLSHDPVVRITLGDKNISSMDNKTEAGTGYFKKTYDAAQVNAGMGNIAVNVTQPNNATNGQPAWGAVYWQYFENMENITTAATPLKLTKKLFIERNTDRGPVLEPIGDNAIVKVGDKIKVRIELRSDRAMEYVHMKDMRAASLEPVNVLSGYRWQGGLGYYESTRDASTNFFFSYLPKGTFVFEYTLFATHTGTFSNGIATIQCMYAPEFASHSEGIKLNVE